MQQRTTIGLAVTGLLAVMLTGCQGLRSAPVITGTTSYQLTVTAPAANQGTITSSPAGINCPTTCSASFTQGTQVTLTATPGTNYYFGGWSGACTGNSTCTVTLNAATTVSAAFNAGQTLSVTIASAPGSTVTASGTVTSSPSGINCSTGTCTATFPPGTQVTLTPTAASGSTFSSWSGACTGTGACTPTLSATTTSVTATFALVGTLQSLNHIILFADENRSFDHYFGFMRQYWANHGVPDQSFDGLPQFNPASGPNLPLQGPAPSIPGCNVAGDVSSCSPDPLNPIQSFSFHSVLLPSGKQGTVCEENQSPFWNEAHNDWDYANPADQPAEVDSTGAPNPPLNGFVFTAAYDARSNAYMDVNGARAMGYFEDSDLNFYYDLATKFATSDHWFSPVMDRTQINRAYMYAATSQGYAYPPGGGVNDNSPFTAQTIFQALQAAGITWKIYVNPVGTSFNGMNCDTAAAGQAQDMCLAGASYMNQFVYESQIQNPANNLWQHFAPIQQFATDLQSDTTFPQFAMIEPASNAGLDEHPSDSDVYPVDVQQGAAYVQQTIIQPFLQSPTWQDSALIFTFDEAGGLYDHVSPQPVPPPGDQNNPTDLVSSINDICTKPGQSLGAGTCTFGWTGYRVPLVVISPYAKQNYVSHTVMDTTAVLALVEDRFGLGQLTNRDGYYKQNTAQGTPTAMAEFFDFVGKPWATAPTPATQSTSGICDQTPAASWNEPPEMTVIVKGKGNVSSSPGSGINACTTECTGVFASGTSVTLTAAPNSGGTFTGWSGACSGNTTCTVTVAGHDFVTATFNP